ncbi:hypothetical protein GUITHDRAFT_141342 [Guillardia theta CCMP2712]|uniref:PPPDE domain-containing protein n=1 Tax=Guillardia theta (strain CCMP2712) TaxID=905079 RepID=L1J2T5_GUITC|nr:hypothetical protein GUITHDRAFT_141342 [Guillardia theta CCMP2712]EKX42405.1 hypothetical protein GUITHDRAFT_141342 [Guillardia theta CCMP2712]|eukprot:XP_005829385.1 hypothetical protein GUITHDRAFT_141342 [Guillardia theta CCMP2712]
MCNVYDLRFQREEGEGGVKGGNAGLSRLGLGLYHSGVEIYGREFSFGYSEGGRTGVFEIPCKCASAVMSQVTFKESVLLGYCQRSRFEVRRNCNHFSNELSKLLVGKPIPSYVNRPANVGQNLLSLFSMPASALGGMLKGVKMVKKAKKRSVGGKSDPVLTRHASI